MYEIAAQVQQWLADGRPVQVAQVVETAGFSSREPGAALAWTSGESVGSLLPMIDTALTTSEADGGRIVDIAVSDADAVAVGLSCGGRASVLVQPASAYPADLWNRLGGREPVCLVTPVRDGVAAASQAYGPTDVRNAARHAGAEDVPRLFGRGVTSAQVLRAGDDSFAVVALWPPSTLVVVGDGSIAAALADAGALLGWSARVTPDPDLAELAALTASDAVVVLSHDRDVDVPALEVALSGSCGYVGGLGSRRTQAARRDGLTARGVSEASQARIHGPAGLDIDAHTPGEIAISIVAEILANRSGSSGGSLRERGGPVHTAGVSAPPPRYSV